MTGWDSDKRRDNYGQNQPSKIPNWELPNILYLHETEGLNYRQIGKMYGVSHVTIKRKVDKAYKWLEEGTYRQSIGKPQSFHNLR